MHAVRPCAESPLNAVTEGAWGSAIVAYSVRVALAGLAVGAVVLVAMMLVALAAQEAHALTTWVALDASASNRQHAKGALASVVKAHSPEVEVRGLLFGSRVREAGRVPAGARAKAWQTLVDRMGQDCCKDARTDFDALLKHLASATPEGEPALLIVLTDDVPDPAPGGALADVSSLRRALAVRGIATCAPSVPVRPEAVPNCVREALAEVGAAEAHGRAKGQEKPIEPPALDRAQTEALSNLGAVAVRGTVALLATFAPGPQALRFPLGATAVGGAGVLLLGAGLLRTIGAARRRRQAERERPLAVVTVGPLELALSPAEPELEVEEGLVLRLDAHGRVVVEGEPAAAAEDGGPRVLELPTSLKTKSGRHVTIELPPETRALGGAR